MSNAGVHRFRGHSHLFCRLEVTEDAVGAVVDLGERSYLGIVGLTRVRVQHTVLVGHTCVVAILKSTTRLK